MAVLSKLKSIMDPSGGGGSGGDDRSGGDETNHNADSINLTHLSLDFGGRDTDTGDEVNKTPSSTLSATAMSDVLKYLHHHDLQMCRQVCADWNNFIKDNLSLFPQHPELEFMIISQHEGIEIASDSLSRKWLDIPQYQHCCKDELKPFAEKMAGKMLEPERDAKEFYQLALFLRGQAAIRLIMRNKLNTTSAFHFLHVLKHFNGWTVGVFILHLGYFPPIPFPCKIRCNCLKINSLNRVPEIKEMEEIVDAFPPGTIDFVVQPATLQGALERIAVFRRPPSSIVPRVLIFEQQNYREVVRFFREQDFRSLFNRALLDLQSAQGNWSRWPMSPFRPKEGTKLKDKDKCKGGCEWPCDQYLFARDGRQVIGPSSIIVHVEPKQYRVSVLEFIFKE